MLTQTTAQTKGVFYDPLVIRGEGNELAGKPVTETFGAFTAAGSQFLVVPVEGREGKNAAPGTEPLRTQSTRNETGVVIPLRNHGVAKPKGSPIDTVSANGNHHALLMRKQRGHRDDHLYHRGHSDAHRCGTPVAARRITARARQRSLRATRTGPS